MTTIEMLKELIENGGMFECENVSGSYVEIVNNNVMWISKKTDIAVEVFGLYGASIKLQWKPYVKPLDWTKVPIDTKVLCLNETGSWSPQHFAGIGETGEPITWDAGRTSHTARAKVRGWDKIKLAE